MYATAIIPALLVIIGRFFITDSGHWLMSRGRVKEAEHELGGPARARAGLSQTGALGGPARRASHAGTGGYRRTLLRGKPARDDTCLGALVPAGPRHLRHRHLHADHSGVDPRSRDRASAQRRRDHQSRHHGREGRGPARHPADRRHHRGRAARRPARTDSTADPRLHRLRHRPRSRRAVEPRSVAGTPCCCSAASCCSTS